MQRRDFLKALGVMPIGVQTAPLWAMNNASMKNVVLIEFKGGNDGLNTVIPYSDSRYYGLRPNIAIPKDQVIAVDDRLGLHPALAALMPLWKNQQLAIVNGVGYENPNRSHFRSIEIWETALASDEYGSMGWLSEYLKHPSLKGDVGSVVLGNSMGPLEGSAQTIMLRDVEKFLKQAQKVRSTPEVSKNKALQHILNIQRSIESSADQLAMKMRRHTPLKTAFPKHAFARDLKTVASMIHADIKSPVYKVSLGSFDTHANQAWKHKQLLEQFASGVQAFHQALEESGQWNNTVVMTYSEFGRRAKENGSRGTDHGTAAPHFILGGQVKGGLYGQQPSFDLMQSNDLVHTVDFKDLYSEIVEQWWGMPRTGPLNQHKVKPLGLLKV